MVKLSVDITFHIDYIYIFQFLSRHRFSDIGCTLQTICVSLALELLLLCFIDGFAVFALPVVALSFLVR